MLELMQFIFQDFWHWIGTVILIYSVSAALFGVVVMLRGVR